MVSHSDTRQSLSHALSLTMTSPTRSCCLGPTFFVLNIHLLGFKNDNPDSQIDQMS